MLVYRQRWNGKGENEKGGVRNLVDFWANLLVSAAGKKNFKTSYVFQILCLYEREIWCQNIVNARRRRKFFKLYGKKHETKDKNCISPRQITENMENQGVKVGKSNVCVGARATGGVSMPEGGVGSRRAAF